MRSVNQEMISAAILSSAVLRQGIDHSSGTAPRPSSQQISHMVREGSLRFWCAANNRYQGQQLVRPVTCGRNDPCVCGSGQKFEKCCLGRV